MPSRGRPQPALADQLRAAITKGKTTQRGLARVLAAQEGTELKNERRWLGKVLGGEVKRPTPASLRGLEKALGLRTGHFKLPDPEPREAKATREANIDRRLTDLETGLTRLTQMLEEEFPKLVRRVQAVERQAKPKKTPAARKQQAGR